MKLTIKHIQLGVVGTLMAAIGIIGCQDPDYPDAQPSTAGYNTSSTRLLFVNATPDASSLRFSVENTLAGTLTPGTSTTYVGVPLGAVAATAPQIRIAGAGGTYGTNDITSKGALLANTSYTYFVTDTINRPLVRNATTNAVTDVGGVRTLLVVDTLTTVGAGSAKVRFFNFAPDVSAASARLTNATSTTSVTNLTNRAYRNVAGANLRYTSVPAGAYVTQVYSGTSIAATATPVTSTTLTLADGKIYTIYARGLNRTKTLSVGTIQHN